MRAAICDDRAEDAQLVAQYVREWGESREESVALEMFPSAEAFLFAYDEDKNDDRVDRVVGMRGIDGVERDPGAGGPLGGLPLGGELPFPLCRGQKF